MLVARKDELRYAVIVEQSHMKKDAASLKSSVMLEWHKVAHFDKLERLHAAKVDSLAAREAALSQKWQQGLNDGQNKRVG
eukprot:3442771-Amphidinium_carterae.1